MQQRPGPYRPLLPAVGGGSGYGENDPGEGAARPKRARHHGTSRVACDACRARKIAVSRRRFFAQYRRGHHQFRPSSSHHGYLVVSSF